MPSDQAPGAVPHGEIGRRVRAVRQERGLTLRQVAARARLSATHISEIERGHTSPTVGALVRVARALGREPHFFLEAKWLPEVSLVRRGDAPRPMGGAPAPAGSFTLTRGIPGGRLCGMRMVLEPHGSSPVRHTVPGEVAGYVLRGRIEIHAGKDVLQLAPGEGFHLSSELARSITNPGNETAEVLCVSTHPADSSR